MASLMIGRIGIFLGVAAVEVASATACGSDGSDDSCQPIARYEIVDPGTGGACEKNGTGLVKDTQTGLTWMRRGASVDPKASDKQKAAAVYCEERGMRLPTVDEARGIAQSNHDECAFGCDWGTWTSSLSFAGTVYYAFSNQEPNSAATTGDEAARGVLCVK